MRSKISGLLGTLILFGYVWLPVNNEAHPNYIKPKGLRGILGIEDDIVAYRHYLVTNKSHLEKKVMTKDSIVKDIKKYPAKYGRWYSVRATKYNPVAEQCDNDPTITADMSKINMRKLNQHNLRWIAVSRDLLNQFRMGDIVEIECDNEKLNGEWEIHDLMNSRFKNQIDFLVPVNDKYEFHKPIIVNIRRRI